MTFKPVQLVHVYYQPDHEKIAVGRLALKSHQIFFEYDADFLTLSLNLSPFKLPLKPGVIPAQDSTFKGLFGVFNDSLPDGWGHLLLDRMLMKQKISPGSLSPLDRLCFVGNHGMGALRYEPAVDETTTAPSDNLDQIANEVQAFQEHDDDHFVEDLVNLGGSSAGARPKILLEHDHHHWIVKFRSSTDPKDIGNIEYAYHLMADAAGLDVPKAKIFPSKTGPGYFGCQRFDKNQGQSIHMHTVSGLMHADHRMPSLDYLNILQATMHLCRDVRECEKLFRHCVFNVFSHNRDDHAKNFSFLMSGDGTWQLSPAYDLTFSSGPSGEHCSLVMGEGKNPGNKQLLELAATANIKKTKAIAIIEEVKSSVSRWPEFASEANVNKSSNNMIRSVLQKIILL